MLNTTNSAVPPEGTPEYNLHVIEASGVPCHIDADKRRVVFKRTNQATIEYFPAKNRWKVAGSPKTVYGSAEALLARIEDDRTAHGAAA